MKRGLVILLLKNDTLKFIKKEFNNYVGAKEWVVKMSKNKCFLFGACRIFGVTYALPSKHHKTIDKEIKWLEEKK